MSFRLVCAFILASSSANLYIMVLHMFICVIRFMVNVTIAVPVPLKMQLEKHPEINWSEVARQAWIAKLSNLEKLHLIDEITKNVKISDEDVEHLARKIKHSLALRHEEEYAKR